MTQKKRILVASFDAWSSVCRLPRAINDAGFEVATFSREADPINLSTFVLERFLIKEKTHEDFIRTLKQAVQDFAPDFVLCADESSLRIIDYIAQELETKEPSAKALTKLLRFSRGDPRYRGQVANKSLLAQLAKRLGIKTPPQGTGQSKDELLKLAKELGYPVVLKMPEGAAGAAVSICKNEKTLEHSYAEFKRPGQHLVLQKFIHGSTLMVNTMALGGRILESVQWQKIKCHPESKGPSSVVKLIDQPEVNRLNRLFAAGTGASGLYSLDFQLDEEGEPHLLECNPRSTPTSHLGNLSGRDLFVALHRELCSEPTLPQAPLRELQVALFPKELQRDKTSHFLHEAHHDVPWDEPTIFKYMLNEVYGS